MPLNYETQVEQRLVAKGFTCDKCGVEHKCDDIVEMQEFFHYRTTGGYGSLWGDGTTVDVVLCQKCATELLAPFARAVEPDWSGSDLCA